MTAATRPPRAEELEFVAARRVARMATVGADDFPVVFPICYAIVEDDAGQPVIVSAIDEKPKSVPTAELQRVRNIRARPFVSLVVDDYFDDWTRLAQVRVRGLGLVVNPGEGVHGRAIETLRAKYPQYREMAIEREPVIAIRNLEASSWRFTPLDPRATVNEPIPRGDVATLDAFVQGRRSVRAFSQRPVPAEIVRDVIEAAGWAPSPHGRQPWRFAVVEAFERRKALADAMAVSWREQLQFDGQDQAMVEHRLARSRERLERAPVLIVPCLYLDDLDIYPDDDRQSAEHIMAIQSIGAAIQNLLLRVYAAGLDAGWMCAPLFCPEIVRDALGLETALHPHALIPLGYAAQDPVRRPRRPVDDLIVSWQ